MDSLSENTFEHLLPPKLKASHKDFKLVSEASYFKIIEAISLEEDCKHTIRLLDTESKLAKENYSKASTLFIQEALRLCLRVGNADAISVENFEMHKKLLAFVTKPYYPLELKEQRAPDTEKLLKEALLDISYLNEKLKLQDLNIASSNIYWMEYSNTFFIGDWSTGVEASERYANLQSLSREVYALGIVLLEVSGVRQQDLETLKTMGEESLYQYLLNSLVKDIKPNSVKKFLQNLSKINPSIRMAVANQRNEAEKEETEGSEEESGKELEGEEETKGTVEEERKAVRPEKDFIEHAEDFEDEEEEKEEGGQKEHQAMSAGEKKTKKKKKPKKKKEKKAQETTQGQKAENAPVLNDDEVHSKLAFCTAFSNTISVSDLITKKQVDVFKGAQIKNGWERTYVDQIPNSNYLVSLHHDPNNTGNFEVFHFAKSPQKVFSLGAVQGVVGVGDIACSKKRQISALLPIQNSVLYHLYDAASRKVSKKAKWQSVHQKAISSMDFDPEGTKIITVDDNGTCLISEVDTENALFSLKLPQGGKDWLLRARWNPIVETPLIAAKFGSNKLNFIDLEKQDLLAKEPFKLDQFDTAWIDWNQEGNLIATCGTDKGVKIFDRRDNKIVKKFENLHKEWINSVRWNLQGNLLATASDDKSVKVFEMTSGNIIYTEGAGGKQSTSGKITNPSNNNRSSNVCMFLREKLRMKIAGGRVFVFNNKICIADRCTFCELRHGDVGLEVKI